ncbi:hypothetical protein [Peptoniphilus lacrimalis]|uniref:Uncharacterized protein n=1 Tax=Peptoniphilus lacrimalis 315-B TaxID=596330 RepID=D1VVJ5_9FIRM|nr:hypothetical protein [Peptoniphilus lacrimalis]EFA89479.1 hypothetical protein HMPREF0628_1449 [Peptoniphilus lacrimalis 315-B]
MESFAKKIKLRKLSKRESLLLTVFLLILIQFILYFFIINTQKTIYDNLVNKDFKDEIIIKNKPYTGLRDFNKDSIDKFLSENNIAKENINESTNHNVDILQVQKDIKVDELANLENLTKYYGYSNINLHRKNQDTYDLILRAEKETKKVSYDDIRKAYFKTDEKSDANNKEEIKQKLQKVSVKENNNSSAKVGGKVSQVRKEKINIEPKKALKKEKKAEKIKEVKDIKEFKEIKKMDIPVEELFIPSKDQIEELKSDPFSIDLRELTSINDNCKLTYIANIYCLSIYYKNSKTEPIILDLANEEDYISFDVLYTKDFKGRIGVITKNNELVTCDDVKDDKDKSLDFGQWIRMEFKEEDIKQIFIEDESEDENIILIRDLRHENNENKSL